mgnify:CR=1 FL=1
MTEKVEKPTPKLPTIQQHQELTEKEITKNINVPLVADVHFHYQRAIEAAEAGAKCLRINPGNIGDKLKIHEVLNAAKNNNCSIRIGVNSGSLERDILEKYKEPCPEALVEIAQNNGYPERSAIRGR